MTRVSHGIDRVDATFGDPNLVRCRGPTRTGGMGGLRAGSARRDVRDAETDVEAVAPDDDATVQGEVYVGRQFVVLAPDVAFELGDLNVILAPYPPVVRQWRGGDDDSQVWPVRRVQVLETQETAAIAQVVDNRIAAGAVFEASERPPRQLHRAAWRRGRRRGRRR